MPFIPNAPDAANENQAELDSVDLEILLAGIKGDGVISGCAVTAQGSPNMTVAVASGVVKVGTTRATVSSGNVTITTAHSLNPRFDLIVVNNSGTPPLFDTALLNVCGKYFNQQGRDMFYSVNSKSSYLKANDEHPSAPTIIKLSDLGAVPGNTLKVARVGTYNDRTELRDGNLTKVAAVFSSTNEITSDKNLNRIPGAIDAGTNVTTGEYFECIIFPICFTIETDIAQDFAVTSGPTVTIPAGAQYLIVAPIPDSLSWTDNSGFGLGVALTVNP
jgi:hypothetical protein